MQHLADLLATIPLPPLEEVPATGTPPAPERCVRLDGDLLHDLGADLPAGHLHVWGGPTGAGKTAFLLALLYGAASRGRRVVYATYDLPPETLAMRLLGMAAGVDAHALPDPGGPVSAGSLDPAELARVTRARDVLRELPFSVLPARGFSTRSLRDRLVRMPFRPEVVAVDFLQGVTREPDTDLGSTLRSLSAMAAHLHVAIVGAVRGGDEAIAPGGSAGTDWGEAVCGPAVDVPDRFGWIAPAGTAGAGRVQVLRNRYGERSEVPLRFDAASGSVQREHG